jgi:hypothetical protein
MAGIERRRHERMRVRFPCELEIGGRRASGTVRDLSAGGLCVQTPLTPQEGDELQLRLHPKGRACVEVRALVWHVHGMRDRRSGERSARLGLVLSQAPGAFLELLDRRAPAPRQGRTPQARPEPAPRAAAPSRPPRRAPERAYRVRVRQLSSSRTCTLLAFACSAEEAKATALAEAGEGWSVLGVARDRRATC